MGRDVSISQPTLEKIIDDLQRLAMGERYRCICGTIASSQSELSIHRQQCELLKAAIIGDVIRVANELEKTPTVEEYQQRRLKLLPSWSTITIEVFDTWYELLIEARLRPMRAQRRNFAKMAPVERK